MSDRQVYYESSTWRVTDFGMEAVHNDDHIAASSLSEIRVCDGKKCAEWVLHLGQKSWVDLDGFIEGLKVALEVHRIGSDKMRNEYIENARQEVLRVKELSRRFS